VAALTDSTGAVTERYRYDAYGKQTITSPTGTVLARSSVNWSRGFTGYIADRETGLCYARSRMYSPGLGRFVSRDPMVYVDGPSVYQAFFVPAGTDPFGLFDMTQWNTLHTFAVSNGPFPMARSALRNWMENGGDLAFPFSNIMSSSEAAAGRDALKALLKHAVANSLSVGTSFPCDSTKTIQAGSFPTDQAVTTSGANDVHLLLGRFSIHGTVGGTLSKKCCGGIFFGPTCEVSGSLTYAYSIDDIYDFNVGDGYNLPGGLVVTASYLNQVKGLLHGENGVTNPHSTSSGTDTETVDVTCVAFASW